jgi:hypothetical protein
VTSLGQLELALKNTGHILIDVELA